MPHPLRPQQGRVLDHLPLARHQYGGARSGALGEEIIQSQGHRFFAAPRSDPFFADLDAFAQGIRLTGRDYVADKDVFSIALAIPNGSLAEHWKMAV